MQRYTIWIAVGAALLVAGCSDAATTAPSPGEAPARVSGNAAAPALQGPQTAIVAFGDSLFAGYGLGPGQSYPSRLEAALRAKGVAARISNAGVSGDTTAAGRERFAFALDGQAQPPALVILELGGNDLLRALPPAQTRDNLDAMLAELAKRKIPALLMGMRAPPNLGAAYAQAFDAIYPALAAKYRVPLVPFFLETVYDKTALIQADHVHPNAQGVEVLVAATVDRVAAALPKPGAPLPPR